MQIGEFFERHSEKARTSLSLIIKVILVISIIYSIYYHLWRILFVNILLLSLIFILYFLEKKCEIRIPKEIEFIFLIFIFVSFFLGDIRGFIIQLFFGLAIGFIGFVIMLILYSNSKLKTNYFMVILFSLSFSVALGSISEILKYYSKLFFDREVTLADYTYAMTSLTLVAIGALVAATIGYIYMKWYKIEIIKMLAA